MYPLKNDNNKSKVFSVLFDKLIPKCIWKSKGQAKWELIAGDIRSCCEAKVIKMEQGMSAETQLGQQNGET